MLIIISLFAITPLQVLAIQRKKKEKEKKEQSRNTLQSTRPQNYVQCKLTGDTSLHCQMRYPKLGSFTVYLLGRKRVTMKPVSEEICVCFNKAIVQSMFKHVASRNGSLVLMLHLVIFSNFHCKVH